MQSRALSLHEYQSQQMLKAAGLPVARGTTARTPEEAYIASRAFFDLVGTPRPLCVREPRPGAAQGALASNSRSEIFLGLPFDSLACGWPRALSRCS